MFLNKLSVLHFISIYIGFLFARALGKWLMSLSKLGALSFIGNYTELLLATHLGKWLMSLGKFSPTGCYWHLHRTLSCNSTW